MAKNSPVPYAPPRPEKPARASTFGSPAERADSHDYLRPQCTGSAYGARVDARLRSQDAMGYPEELDPEGDDPYGFFY
jgi:hypothetical protein